MLDRPEPSGPDLTLGLAQDKFADGATLLGRVGEEEVLLARIGSEFFAVGARCTHYRGPLAEGLVVGGTIRCPWHHACFDLQVRLFGRRPLIPCHVGWLNSGATAYLLAYLAGNSSEERVPLRPESFYSDNAIDLRLATEVARLDPGSREIALSDGRIVSYDRLLLATGAEPVRLWIPRADQAHVHSLRSLADCRTIIARAQTARSAIILGASFIGLEVAAALRSRGIDVHVVAPEKRPLERILGQQMGRFVQSLHEEHGVVFQTTLTLSWHNVSDDHAR